MTQRPHGYARYKLDACRCYTCAWAVSQYNLEREKAIRAGTWQPFADAAPVRAHIEAHARTGIGYKRLAGLAGVSHSAVGAILFGRRGNPPSAKIRRETADRLLAIAVGDTAPADHALVDATGTHRRIQALATIGWSLTKQAHRIGWAIHNYAAVLDRTHVIAETARLVARLYDQLSMTPAPHDRSGKLARSRAQQQGWLPPLAWDDDTIDDPDAVPAFAVLGEGEDAADEGLVWLALHGYLELGELLPAERQVVRRHQREAARAVAA